MFTGIVEEVGIVQSGSPSRLTIKAGIVMEGTRLGDSIAVNGACLTVTALEAAAFAVDVSPETLRRTNLGMLQPGAKVNLERALTLSSRLGGHLVQGHIDATGKLTSMVRKESFIAARFSAPPEVTRYVVEKGFIAVDGMSLTVTEFGPDWFAVSLIPFTLEQTNLSIRRVGDMVNLEVDIIAKYVEKLKAGSSGVTQEFLARHGFLSNSPAP